MLERGRGIKQKFANWATRVSARALFIISDYDQQLVDYALSIQDAEKRRMAIQLEKEHIQSRMGFAEKTHLKHFYNYQLGRLYLATDDYQLALSFYEQTLLEVETDNPNFPIYAQGYTSALRERLQKDIIPPIERREKKDLKPELDDVLDSTEHVLDKHPQLEEIGRERLAAVRWLAQASGQSFDRIIRERKKPKS